MVEVAKALEAEPWLEAVVTKVEGFEDEIAELGKTVAAMGSPFTAVFLSPAPDMKSTQPTGPWPPCPPLADIYQLARQLFPEAAHRRRHDELFHRAQPQAAADRTCRFRELSPIRRLSMRVTTVR